METYSFMPLFNPAPPVFNKPDVVTEVRGPQRWDTPFSTSMSKGDVQRLLELEPFCSMDPARFPANCALADLLLNDARIVKHKQGDLIVREGDYGNSAFLILSGRVRIALESLPANLLGRTDRQSKSLIKAAARLWNRSSHPEQRRNVGLASPATGLRDEGGALRVFLQDVPGVLQSHRTLTLQEGELFGELAALSRTPRTATVFADGDCELLEIRWQGLRDICRRAPEFKAHVDRLYRQNSLLAHLRETDILHGLTDAGLQAVAEATEFETYGDFEWQKDFRKQSALTNSELFENEPLIVAEGAPFDGLVLIRSGFARVSHAWGEGRQTISYLGKGGVYGAGELLKADSTSHVAWRFSLSAVGYVDVLKIPRALCQQLIVPSWDESFARSIPNLDTLLSAAHRGKIDTGLLEFLMDGRFINGSQAMVIDLNRCTRCDDCVRACAATHDGNPRFVRQGMSHSGMLFAEACMHCADPVCLIGCPTGAIAREPTGGQVLINDSTCIGCSTCANSCPYSAIRMVEIRDEQGALILDEAKGKAVLKATKCDLCVDQPSGPACQQACSHDALLRMDLRDGAALRWFKERR